MVKHNLRLKVITAALLALLMISAVLLAACDTGTSEGDIFESIPDLGSMSTDSSVRHVLGKTAHTGRLCGYPGNL